MALTYGSSAAVPRSVLSPVSTTTSILNCSTTDSTMSYAVGFRCRSLMCSTRRLPSSGTNVRSPLVTV
jgi:hypothetical protein